MPPPSRYEFEIRGLATERVLRPAVDDFRVEATGQGTTRLVGDIRDASHLNGLLAHFTSMNVEVVELRRLDHPTTTESPHQPDTTTKGTTP